jgi:type IV pilus assembly protein PilQ
MRQTPTKMMHCRPLRFALMMVAALSIITLWGPYLFAQGHMDTGTVSRYAPSRYFGISGGERYDISFRRASLREVVQFLAWIADINIMIPEGIDGVVNTKFRDIGVVDALNTILKANSLEYTLEGNVMRIGKGDQFKETGEDLKTQTFRLRFAPAKEMGSKIQVLLSSRGSVIADERTNSLVVREIPSNIDKVRRFIEDVDIKDAQVLIESKILEATRSFSRSIGIQWGINRGADGSRIRVGGVSDVGQADSGRNLNVNLPPDSPTSGLLIGSLFKGTNIDVQILAAEQRGDAYVISDPSIVTSNGKSANIRSGATLLVQGAGTVNIGTGTGATSTTAGGGLQEIETGVELTVTPQIMLDDYVKLDIEAVTSNPDFSRAVQGIPIIVDNTATTTVLVKDGETTVIGGLTRFADSLSKRRVPYLSRIPLLGNLFKSKDRVAENTELMVFIKPTVIRVEGIAPAQVRIRDLEERKEAMFLKPMLDPHKDIQKKMRKASRAKRRKGNKYVR